VREGERGKESRRERRKRFGNRNLPQVSDFPFGEERKDQDAALRAC